ncbi:hypothetical protein HDV05_001465 [Chytridiales sp. JEL 0842]|nr:hypothetical protein HDV05_001465 [Chytridiales sp. JEL 0842]
MNRTRTLSHDSLRAPPMPSFPPPSSESTAFGNHQHDSSAGSSTYLPIEYTSITAHSFSSTRLIAYYILSVLTLGILPLVCKHKVALRVQLTRAACPSFRDADFVLVETLDGSFEEVDIIRIRGKMKMDVAGGIVAGPTGVWDPVLASTENGNQGVSAIESQIQLQEERSGLLGFHGIHLRGRSQPGLSGIENDSVERTFAFFEYKKQRYVYREGTNTFLRLSTRLSVQFEELHRLRTGLSQSEAIGIWCRNGPNLVDIDTVPISKMLADKLAHPFYLFQVASVFIWFYQMYYVYALVIVITSILSIIWEIYTAKANEKSLKDLLTTSDSARVTVLRDSEQHRISPRHLVVGDAVILDSVELPAVADMVLVQGGAVVDESSLTGESVPVVKVALGFFDKRGEKFEPHKCKSSVIYAGSRVVELKPAPYAGASFGAESARDGQGLDGNHIVGIVIATGFHSVKGELFRNILFPTKIDFKFYRDSFKFIFALGLVAIAAFILRVVNGFKQGLGTTWVLITSLDLITIAVPPALPLVLTVGISLALRRLKSKNIYCISPDRINFAGRINVFCWDKTGTLTQSHVSWAGLERCRDGKMCGYRPFLDSTSMTGSIDTLNAHLSQDREASTDAIDIDVEQDNDGDLEIAVAACHTLNDVHGELLGSPIDQELFQSTGWKLHHHKWTTTIGGDNNNTHEAGNRVLPVLATIRKVSGVVSTTATTAGGSGLVVVSGGGPTPFNTPAGGTFPSSTPASATFPSTPLTPGLPSSNTEGNLAPPSVNIQTRPPAIVTSTGELPSPRTLKGAEAHILRRFDFEAHLQRSSVLFKFDDSDTIYAVSKGSPESIRNICKSSTIPSDYYDTQMGYAGRGYYVLAYALKPLSVAGSAAIVPKGSMKSNGKLGVHIEKPTLPENFTAEDLAGCKREAVERDLRFIGFVVMKNPLKAESNATMTLMRDAGIESVIITGDSSMTAISVSRELNLCQDVLLIDAYDQGLGFRKIKDPNAKETLPNDTLATAPLLNSENSQGHVNRMVSSPAQESPSPPPPRKAPPAHIHTRPRSNLNPTLAVSMDSIATQSMATPQITINSGAGPTHHHHLSKHLSMENMSRRRGVSMSQYQPPQTFPVDELGRVFNAARAMEMAAHKPHEPEPTDKPSISKRLLPNAIKAVKDEPEDFPPGTAIAVTGAALEQMISTMEDDFLNWMVLNTRIFARIKPDQKAWIVERMMKNGKYVGMCGDGANDTGALKAAHVGIALSDAEASIVAPFTSTRRSVADVPKLIAEGRCALDTSFIAFKYMFMYPIVQLAMTATLYQMGSGMANNQFLFDDMAVVLVLAVLMLKVGPSRRMGKQRPTDDLFSPLIMFSIAGQLVINIGFFAINIVDLVQQDWYCSVAKAKTGLDSTWKPLDPSAPRNVTYPCYFISPETDTIENMLIKTQENTSVWLFTHFQFAILAFVFAAISPFRRPIWTNVAFIAYFILCILGLTSMLLIDDKDPSFPNFSSMFTIREGVGRDYRVSAIYLAATNFLLSLTWEVVIVDRIVRRWTISREHKEKVKQDTLLSRKAGCLVDDRDAKNHMLNKLGPRLNMAAAMQMARSWTEAASRISPRHSSSGNSHREPVSWVGNFRDEQTQRLTGGNGGGERNSAVADIGEHRYPFPVEADGFDEGFDAWKGRRRT